MRAIVIVWHTNYNKYSSGREARTLIDKLIDDTGIRKEELERAPVIRWDRKYGKNQEIG